MSKRLSVQKTFNTRSKRRRCEAGDVPLVSNSEPPQNTLENDRQNQLLREALSLLGVNSPPNASNTTFLDFFEANKSKAAASKLQNDSLELVNRNASTKSQLAISSNLPIFSTLAVSPAITTDDVLTPLSISLPTSSANESLSNKFNTPPTNFIVTPLATTDELAKEELRKALSKLTTASDILPVSPPSASTVLLQTSISVNEINHRSVYIAPVLKEWILSGKYVNFASLLVP
ncbi:unnamed protein product [Didymodactylos carnosus]|uniref:Uncharacterized protein n=1 Tax=Didymodactylos carnosus TaxID=1234261 RepID=A0A814X753_9BILA|nr:unnamed protein product [Didymodactylos carnosus]CAF3979154.1 unnamed protein product [Didymodactylos carnosus]